MAKNVTVTPADGDIQFENSSGTAAGRIEQNGDDLVISNAVGDVLFGDANADVYIGDGVNSVDLLFEQSGSVKAEDGSTGVTLTLGSSDTILSLYAPQLTTTMTIGTSGSIDYTPDTGTVLSFDGQSIIRRLNANGGVSIGHDDQVIIAGGDTSSTMDSNVTGEVVAIGAEGGLLVYGFPNNNTSWSNRAQFSLSNDGKMYFGTASDTNIYRSAANTLKTDDSFVVGSRLYVTTLDANTTSTSALVLGASNEIEKRTLGSNAFTSYTDHSSQGYLTSYTETDTLATVTGRGASTSTDSTFSGTLTASGTLDVTGTLKDNDYQHSGSTYWRTKKYVRSVGGAGGDIGGKWVQLVRVDIDAAYEKATIKFTINGYDDVSSGVEAIDVRYENGSTAQESHTLNWYSTDDLANLFSEVRSIRSGSDGLTNRYDVYVKMAGDWRDTFTVVAEYWTTHGSSTGVSFVDSDGSATEPAAGSNDITKTSRVWYTENTDMYFGSNKVWHAGNDGASSGLDADTLDGNQASAFLLKSGGTMTGNVLLGTNKIAADTTTPTAHIQVGAGTSNTGNRSDVALLGASNSGGVVNALGLVNTAAGANSNGVALNFHNGNSWSPTGQIITQQDSSGTSTNSAMKFYTYSGGLNHRMSIKSDGTVRFLAYGAGLIASDANGNLSVDTSSYLTGIADNSIGISELNVTDGTAGQVLTTDGNGTLSFSTVSAGTNYTLPTASSSALGGVKIGYTANAKNYPVVLDSNDKAYVNVPWTDTNTNTTYSAGSGLGLSGTTFSVDEFIEDKHIYTKNENGTANKGIFMPMVKGGFYATSTSTITGRLKVVLPSFKTNMMVSFKLDIYEYNTDRTVSYQISGYNNNDGNATWYNTSVVCLSDSDNRNLTVRFLRDLDAEEQYIGIGETTTTWSYPQVIVRDFMGGYNTQIQKASGSWSVNFVEDDPGVVVNTHSNNTPIVLTSRLSGTISTTQLADNSVNAAKLNVSGNGTSGQVLTSDGDGTFSWTAKTTNTNTVTSVGVSGSETTGTVTIAGSGATSVSQSGNTITISSTDTNTNTTYSAGSGLDLTSTTFSVEADLRDGITHVGKDTNNYITFDSTNGRIDFYAGGNFVARMESDGDLHIKGDVIAFSNIFG